MPTETHEHYDAEGNLTGSTVVTRESPWTEDERQWRLSYEEYRAGIHGPCGNHLEHGLDRTVARDVQRMPVQCEDCAAIETERKRWHKEHRHDDDKVECDCHRQVFYIAERIPLERLGIQK